MSDDGNVVQLRSDEAEELGRMNLRNHRLKGASAILSDEYYRLAAEYESLTELHELLINQLGKAQSRLVSNEKARRRIKILLERQIKTLANRTRWLPIATFVSGFVLAGLLAKFVVG